MIQSLLLVLLLQGIMIGVLYWPNATLMEVINRDKLVNFRAQQVDEIHIGDSHDNEAVLLKTGDRWILPDLGGLEVAPQLIKNLIEGVLLAESGWPVANSVSAMQRFHLADYKFQRRLSLITEGRLLGTIYLGTSPGFQKVYAKNSEQRAIFSLPFNSRDASAKSADWLDKRTLQIANPQQLSVGNLTFNREQGRWSTDLPSSATKQELDSLLDALARIEIENVADARTHNVLSIAVPDLQLDIESQAKTTTYQFFTLGDKHYVHCSDHALFFGLSANHFDRFSTLNLKQSDGKTQSHRE